MDREVNPHELRDMISRYQPSQAIIQRVAPMPRKGVRQSWRFSAAHPGARTVVTLLNIPTMLVTPGTWKKALGHRRPGRQGRSS